MSDNTKKNLELLGLFLALALSIAAIGQAWFTLPYRIEKAEQSIAETVKDRELLVRIDERLARLQADLAELKARTKRD